MSTPSFLLPSAAKASDRFRPLRRSPMARRLAEAGAKFEERDGWSVAVSVPGEERREPRIRDATHRFSVYEGAVDAEPASCDGDLALRLPSGRGFLAREAAGGDAPGAMLDLTAAYAALEVEGGDASALMRRLTALDLDALPAVGALAHLRAWIFRPQPERYLIFFPQEYGHYLWDVAVDAAQPLGGGPAA